MMQQYKGADFGELSPHPFAVADVAYRWVHSEICFIACNACPKKEFSVAISFIPFVDVAFR
jgi:hypothetical protein